MLSTAEEMKLLTGVIGTLAGIIQDLTTAIQGVVGPAAATNPPGTGTTQIMGGEMTETPFDSLANKAGGSKATEGGPDPSDV